VVCVLCAVLSATGITSARF